MTQPGRALDLFTAARALTGSERHAFLEAVCGEDPGLLGEIEALLAADTIDDDFLTPVSSGGVVNALYWESRPVQPGTVLKERYEIEECIATGGQAAVYRATDRRLSRSVVVKLMRSASHHDLLKAWFQKEMSALARIDHPGVVGIFDVGELDDGSPFLVIQYVNGVSLRALIEQGPIDRPRAIGLLRSIASALTAAHSAGVGHHDLKPENVMVQQLPDGTDGVKLIDFGIAKIRESDLHGGVTTVFIAGSVRYMAPEQFQGRNVVASDLYALGLLACELLCGEPDARALPASMARRVRPLIERALAFRPEDRPADAGRWVDDLEKALDPVPTWGRWLVPAAATVAVVIAAAALFLPRAAVSDERIIEKVGAFNPVVEGFQAYNRPIGTVVRNADHTGFIGWSVTSDHPGGADYYRRLSGAQIQRALARGWRFSVTMHPDEGAAFAVIDLGPNGKRFDINVLAEPPLNLVRLNTQIVPTIEGLTLTLPRVGTTYYKYELRFDPSLQAADLWVDGVKRLNGYRGHQQFQEGRNVSFGTAAHKSPRGMASFLSVRFEINP